ncbi:MAG: protein-export chaperone SecB [Bdellovibrionales bacterium]
MVSQPPVPNTTDSQDAPVSVPISVTSQYVRDLSFENPNAPAIFSSSQTAPEMQLGVNVQTRGLGESSFEVVLSLKMESRMEEKTMFIAELVYAGVFGLPSMPDDQLRFFLLVECPRILFPFARSILGNAVRDGGFPNIMINPIDFLGLYMANKDNIGTMPVAGAA